MNDQCSSLARAGAAVARNGLNAKVKVIADQADGSGEQALQTHQQIDAKNVIAWLVHIAALLLAIAFFAVAIAA